MFEKFSFSWPELSVAGSTLPVGKIVIAAFLIVATWWVASALEKAALKIADKRSAGDPGSVSMVHMLSRLVRYAIWVLGTLVGLNQLGIDLSSIALLGSAFAVGLGFGLQTIISNFISGVILLVERTLRVGDFVDLESGVRGHVREIAMRYTRITTNDAVDVLVPNSEFMNKRVINWTHYEQVRRLRIPFSAAYGVKKELVREAGLAAAPKVQGVLTAAGHQPQVWLVGFGDNAMDYELVVWVNRELTTHPASAKAKLLWAIDDELQARGIEIPFPQRDLHWRSGPLKVEVMNAFAAPDSGAKTV